MDKHSSLFLYAVYVKHIIFKQNIVSRLFLMQYNKNLDFFEHNFDVLAYSNKNAQTL